MGDLAPRGYGSRRSATPRGTSLREVMGRGAPRRAVIGPPKGQQPRGDPSSARVHGLKGHQLGRCNVRGPVGATNCASRSAASHNLAERGPPWRRGAPRPITSRSEVPQGCATYLLQGRVVENSGVGAGGKLGGLPSICLPAIWEAPYTYLHLPTSIYLSPSTYLHLPISIYPSPYTPP